MVLYPPPTRPWLYCRVCGVRLTREPIDVPFPGHESWCSQEKWRRIVYKACCRPLHRWLQRWRRLLFKAAQSPFPSMVFSAVASQAPSGDSWPRRMSDESSSSLGDPLGIARFFKPRRRETKETKDDLEAQVQGMHDCLVDLAARTWRTEEALKAAKDEINAAKERIGNLEAQVQALQEATCHAPQPAVVARDAPQLAGVPGDAPPCDQWHESRPHAKHVDASTGEQVGKADDWLHHLRNTLFVDDTRILDKLEDRIKGSWPYIQVLACKTRANRFFYVCCMKCRQFSYGDYGTWAIGKDPEAPERARHDLAKFFKLEVTSDGGRIV